ncbi:MAG: hypothetical protein PHU80_11130 [Kiritimatiellae bacterium]|nr:hypothetical protein [Kiritimatiellia bacterium]
MSLVKFIIVLVVIGVGMWAVNTYTPVTPGIKAVITALLVGGLCLWLLNVFGVIVSLKSLWG